MPEGLSAGEIDAAVKRIVGEGKALYSLDEERLAELAPDLIVTQAVCEVCAVSYEDVVEVAARLPGPPRVLQQDPSSLTEVLADLARLGEAAGVGERAAALRAELEERLDAVRAAVAGAPRPRVIALEWLDPPFIGGHWIPEMVELAGGVDVVGTAGAKSPEVPWERLEGLDPDVVVVMPCGWYLDESRAQAEAAPRADRRPRRLPRLRRRRRLDLLAPRPAPGRRDRAARPPLPSRPRRPARRDRLRRPLRRDHPAGAGTALAICA